MKNNIGITEDALAKINLFLDVTGRTEDGFHSIDSIMQSVNLCDRVRISARQAACPSVKIDCNLPYIPRDERNIAYKCAVEYMMAAKISADVSISISKRIPVAAGLAGGSTDGAATLVALNRLFGTPFSKKKLCEIGASLGSDIPFCILGGCMHSTGRGEILEKIDSTASLKLLIAADGEGVSTPYAYGELDGAYADFSSRQSVCDRRDALIDGLLRGDAATVAASVYNIFEGVILPRRPRAQLIKDTMLENGALGAMMSGSGPSIFGIFESDEARAAAAAALGALGIAAKKCEST